MISDSMLGLIEQVLVMSMVGRWSKGWAKLEECEERRFDTLTVTGKCILTFRDGLFILVSSSVSFHSVSALCC